MSAPTESVPPPDSEWAEPTRTPDQLVVPPSLVTERRRVGARRQALIGLVVFALLAAGAVLALGSAGPPRSHKLLSASSWSRLDLRPVSQPAPVDGRLVLFVARPGGLLVMALDGRSGGTVWSDVASRSFIAPGEPPSIAIVDGLVVYLRPAGRQVARLVGVNPANGKTIWQSRPGAFTSSAIPCSDDLAMVCSTGYLASEPFGASYLRFDGRSGALLPSAAISPGTTARMLGDGLFDPGARQPEELLAVKGASIAWTRTLASVFTMPGASTDWGWGFDRIARDGLYIGSVGGRPLTLTRSLAVGDLSRNMIAGFRVSDGSVVWRAQGAGYACGLLPCPGSVQTGWADAAAVRGGGPTEGVALRATGLVTASPQDPAAARVSPDANASLYGFDPATGRAVWHFDAGHDLDLLKQLSLPPQTALNTIVLKDTRGRLVALDLANGSHEPITALTPAWCRSQTFYKESVPYPGLYRMSLTTYSGQPSFYPCTAAGRPAATPSQIPAFIGEIGARLDGLVAWSTSTGVFARRL